MSLHSWLLHFTLASGRIQRQYRRHNSVRARAPRPSLEVLEDRSVPAFLAPVDYSVGAGPGAYCWDVEVGDFNGDAIPDLATANSWGQSVSVLLGNPDGSFQPALNTPTATSLSLAVGDFNDDGKLDIATGNYYTVQDGVTVLLGNGDGTFLPGPRIQGFQWADSIATGDLNADGTLDLVTMSIGSVNDFEPVIYVSVMLGHGDGTFAFSWSGPYEGYFTSLALGDVDGDGDDDVAVGGDDVMVFPSNGDGTLAAPRDIGIVGGALAVADFDADGKLDLATTDGSNSGNTLLGNGNGTFQPAQSFAVGANIGSLDAGDVNGDDVLDLVVSTWNGTNGSVTALLGNGNGSFRQPIATLVGSPALSLVLADLNADGRRDATLASPWLNKVLVLFNDGIWDGSPPPPPPSPSISIDDLTLAEGANNRTTQFTFTVTLSTASSETVTVNFATANGTATAGSDYLSKTGSVAFLPGELTKTITITVKGDKTKEADESFFVNLSSAIGGQIVDGQGVGTILNDDTGGGKGGKGSSSASSVDAAIEELLNGGRRKRGR